MKNFTNMAAQGDFIIMRVKEIPAGMIALEPENGVFVVAHSETGHNHVMDRTNVQAFIPANKKNTDIFEMFLNVAEPTPIQHLRSFDTHESIMVPAGNYVVKRQREYIPEGFRKAQD